MFWIHGQSEKKIISGRKVLEKMLVSVISSVYNCEEYVGEMLDSILAQSFQDWELILVDDASTDKTWKVISAYKDSRIIKIQNDKNVGLTCNLNKALCLAKGKYIIRMDGDDLSEPERFEKQVVFMESNPHVVVSGCNMQYFGMKHGKTRVEQSDKKLRVNMLFNSVICHPTFIIRKDILDSNSIVYNEKLKYAQDYNLLYFLMQYGELANLPECLVRYRVHNEQISIMKNEQQKQCANYTRKLMLELLNIDLSGEEEVCWYKFCLGSAEGLNDTNKKMILEIQSKILRKNQKLKIFDEDFLKEALEEKEQKIICESAGKARTLEEKHLQLFLMMNQWVKIKQAGKNLADYLKERGYRKIAIYGMSYVGETLLSEFQKTEIEVVYGIDKNADKLSLDLEVVTLKNNKLKEVDAVVVTAISFYQEIKEQLSEKLNCPILSLENILYEM